MQKVANVHEIYVTDEHVVVGIKTNAPVDEAAIRAILRKNHSATLFPVVVPAEPAA